MADDVIQSIKISAHADTKDAQKSITALTQKLKELKDALGKGFKDPNMKWTEKLASDVGKLKDVPFDSIAKGIDALADSLNHLNGIKIDPNLAAQLSSFIKLSKEVERSHSKYKPNWTTGVISPAPKRRQMQYPAVARNYWTYGKQKQPTGWVYGDQNLASKAYPVPVSSGAIQPFQSNREVIEGVWREITSNAGHNLGDALGGFARHGLGIDSLGGMSDPDLKKMNMAQIVKGNLDEATPSARSFADALKAIGFSATSVTNALKSLLSGGIKKVAVGLKEATKWLGKMLGSMAIAPFRKLGTGIRDITKRLSGFFSALKRIAVYRAIRWALKELTQAFKEGIDNLYQYSILINGKFKQSMDSLATSALYAKNSLAAMVAPIINQLAPAVDVLVDKFVDLLNTVNEALAAMTGAETWTKALKYPKEYAEAADDANGSAKKLRATLLGFDEINRLDDNRKSSRGKQSDLLDYSKMFEEKPVTSKISKYIDAIKKAFKTGNFTEIGHDIGQQLKEGLDRIPWSDIERRISKNASSVATLINGFINVDGLGTSIGRSIGKAFNVAVTKVNTFFGTVEWKKLGTFLGDGLSSAFNTFDSKKLGETFALIINSGVELIGGFVDSVNWHHFADFFSDGINGFFTELKTKELGETISDVIVDALTFVTDFLHDTDFEQIGKKIGELIKGIKWGEVLDGLADLVVEGIIAALKGIGGLIEESPLIGLPIATAIASAIAGALGLPTVTSIITGAITSAVGAGAAGATGTGAAGAAGAGTAAAGGAASGGTSLLAKVLGVSAAGYGGYKLGNWLYENTGVGDVVDTLFGNKQGHDLKFEDEQRKILYNIGDEEYAKNKAAYAARNAASKAASEYEGQFVGGFNTEALKKVYTDPDVKNAYKVALKEGTNESKLPDLMTAMKGKEEAIKKSMEDKVIPEIQKTKKVDIDLDLTLGGGSGGSSSAMNSTLKLSKISTKYASGGEPQTGTVFLAGERGAEIISSKGGHTQVANRDQISQSVAYGMEQANAESNQLLREQNKLLRAILEKDTNFVVPITTGQVTNALDRQNRREGRAVVAVGG